VTQHGSSTTVDAQTLSEYPSDAARLHLTDDSTKRVVGSEGAREDVKLRDVRGSKGDSAYSATEREMTIEELVAVLERYVSALRLGRDRDHCANDLFEAADDALSLARHISNDDRWVDYSGRVAQERDTWRTLAVEFHGMCAGDWQMFAEIREIVNDVLALATARAAEPGGYRGFLKVIQENFKFLETEYAFKLVRSQPTRALYSSGDVDVTLKYANDHASSCMFGPTGSSQVFWLANLLFLFHDSRYDALTPALSLTSERDIQEWFGYAARILRELGNDVLSNCPGIFEKLAHAQAQQDLLFAERIRADFVH